jgi:hypothetical protein
LTPPLVTTLFGTGYGYQFFGAPGHRPGVDLVAPRELENALRCTTAGGRAGRPSTDR